MTITASRKNRRVAKTSDSPESRTALKARAAKVLEREIQFIPNPCFREMDADGLWKELLTSSEPEAFPHAAQAPGRRGMPAHLEQMCAAPLLTPAEEQDLFCKMNYLKYRANAIRSTLSRKRPNVRKLEQIEQLLKRAEHFRNCIVRSNTRLVVSIVKQFADEKNPFDDVLSEGVHCLLKVVEKFDFDRGFRFSTYATLAIRREVFRLIKRSHRNRSRFATGAEEALDQQIDAIVPTERSETALKKLNSGMAQLITRLGEREQYIVKARYGFVDLGMKPSFSKLGEKLGVSKERVRQLEARAMEKLRELADELQLSELYSPA